VRVAFVVSRKVGKAVVRNLVRRRLRESLRAMLRATPDGAEATAPRGVGPDGRWPASFDALVIVRPSAAAADYRELGEALRRALDQASAPARSPGPESPTPKTPPAATDTRASTGSA
jgi:ribonuclease P protein component